MLLRDTLGFISLLQCLKPSGSNRWPAGTYGIPKPDSGCPKTDHFQWLEGWRSQGSDSSNVNNSCSAEFHLDGTVDNTKVNRSFCIKDNTTYDSIRPVWPKGQYCIYKKGACPYVMHGGFVKWDDENSLNANSKGGTRPGGKYVGDNTEIRFCCRTDGDKREPVILPTKLPFFLLAYGSDECQMVKWAIATLEWIYYDTEKVNNTDDRRWAYPYNAETQHPKIHYCYYRGCNTSLNGTRGTFHSPNYPAKYSDGQYCSWRITVGPAQRIHLVFTTFSLQNENNTDALYVYDGKSEEGKELGVFYGKHPPPMRGIYSSSNQIFFMFISDSNVSYTGFNASYCENQCPETTTAASTLSVVTKSVTSKESTTTKGGAKRHKKEGSEEKGVNVVAVVVPVVILIILVFLILAAFFYYKRRGSTKLDKETPNVIYASPQMAHDNPSTDSPQTAHDNPSTDRSTGRPPLSVGNPCYERRQIQNEGHRSQVTSQVRVQDTMLSGFISIANDECPEAFELYSSLNPNTMDRREACGQPDEQYQTLYRGAPVYDTLEPGQAASNPIYESTF